YSVSVTPAHRDDDHEHMSERRRVSTESHWILRIGDAAEEGNRERAAGLDEPLHVLGRGIGDEVEVRGDHEAVAREVALWMDEVDRNVAFPERPVPVGDLVE